ncbi:hypothetical protein EDD85DRAFT_831802 [Armillaria nabsnona]|nr:hypothetical protein EDD85DRAFT_831802 [Armillaria nabsnona]
MPSTLKSYRHRGEIKTVGYHSHRPPTSLELKAALDLSASPRFYKHVLELDSTVRLEHERSDHNRSKEADAKERQLLQRLDAVESRVGYLERCKEDSDRKLADQLQYEVVDRFCRGLTEQLRKKLVNLKGLLRGLSSRLDNDALRNPPNAFVFLAFYDLLHKDRKLPEVFYLLPSDLHSRNVATLNRIQPDSETALTALGALVDGPHGPEIKLLTYLWAIRASLGGERNYSAHPVPGLNLAYSTLQDLVDDAELQAQIFDILPSLVDASGYRNVKYFSSVER